MKFILYCPETEGYVHKEMSSEEFWVRKLSHEKMSLLKTFNSVEFAKIQARKLMEDEEFKGLTWHVYRLLDAPITFVSEV